MHASTLAIDGRSWAERADTLAVEEPLEIRLAWRSALSTPRSLVAPGAQAPVVERPLSITMRTPGADVELALGFLVGEGIIRSTEDVASSEHCGPPVRSDGSSNIVRVTLRRGQAVDMARL